MPAKVQRLEARVTRRQKLMLQRAADISGRSLTDFVVSSAQEAAKQTILDHEVMVLSARDQAAFVDALLHPPEANAALQAAMKRYRSGRLR